MVIDTGYIRLMHGQCALATLPPRGGLDLAVEVLLTPDSTPQSETVAKSPAHLI